MLGLLGPNGAGKTTLINILSTLLPPSSGTARVAGFDVSSHGNEVRSRIGLTGQFASVDEQLSGFDNLLLIGRLLGASRRQARQAPRSCWSCSRSPCRPPPGPHLFRRHARRLICGQPGRRLNVVRRAHDRSNPVTYGYVANRGIDGRPHRAAHHAVPEEADRLADSITVLSAGQVIAAGTSEELKSRVGQRTITATFRRPSEAQRAAEQLRKAGMEVTRDEQQAAVTIPVARARELADVVRVLDAADVEADDLTLREPTLDDVYLALTHRTPASTN